MDIMCWDFVEMADMSTDLVTKNLVIQSNKIRTTKRVVQNVA